MKCAICGKEKNDVVVRINPFVEEIYGEIVEEALCDECYQNECDDI